MIYDVPIKIIKKGDKEYTISVKVSDNTLIVKTCSQSQLEQLSIEIEKLLKEQ